MSRPRCLSLYSGAQGTAVGLARAGFEVHASDIEDHPLHPEIATFTRASAIEAEQVAGEWVITGGLLADVEFCRSFDLIEAAPPCNDHSDLSSRVGEHGTGWMLPATLAALRVIGVPWVVENVDSAALLRGSLMLCGSMFGLGAMCRDGVWRQLRRHRLLASSLLLYPPGPCRHVGQPVGVYGTGGGGQMTRGYKAHPEEAAEAMGIDWMSREDRAQAIPPAYGEWVGRQAMDHLTNERIGAMA